MFKRRISGLQGGEKWEEGEESAQSGASERVLFAKYV
jgi:hypothetical protein